MISVNSIIDPIRFIDVNVSLRQLVSFLFELVGTVSSVRNNQKDDDASYSIFILFSSLLFRNYYLFHG